MNIFKFFSLSLFILLSFSYANDEEEPTGGIHIGNGGVVVKCTTSIDSYTYELLDFYEKEVGIKIKYVDPKVAPLEIARSVIAKIERLDKNRYKTLKRYIDTFYENQIFIKRSERLVNLSDTGFSFLSKKCKLEQAAIQREKVVNNQVKFNYVFDKNIWENLSNINKAGLILHEVIYRDFYNTSSHNSSYYVRKFIRILFSDKIDTFTFKEYLLQLSLLKVKKYVLNDMVINLQKKFLAERREVKYAHPMIPQTFKVHGKSFTTYSPMKINFVNNRKKRISVVPEYGDLKESVLYNYKSNNDEIKLYVTPHFFNFYPGEDQKIYSLQVYSGNVYLNGAHYAIVPETNILYEYQSQVPAELQVYSQKNRTFYKILLHKGKYTLIKVKGGITRVP